MLMVPKGEMGAIGTMDKESMGYYVVKWLSKPYALQDDTNGMSGIINAGVLVADALYFNRVKVRTLLLYTVRDNVGGQGKECATDWRAVARNQQQQQIATNMQQNGGSAAEGSQGASP